MTRFWIREHVDPASVKNERNTHSQISVWITFQTEEDMWVDQKEDGETNTHEEGTSKKMAF
jgi:hypothetical protein